MRSRKFCRPMYNNNHTRIHTRTYVYIIGYFINYERTHCTRWNSAFISIRWRLIEVKSDDRPENKTEETVILERFGGVNDCLLIFTINYIRRNVPTNGNDDSDFVINSVIAADVFDEKRFSTTAITNYHPTLPR